MTNVLQTKGITYETETDVCHIFKSTTYCFKKKPENSEIEKDTKKVQYHMGTVKHYKDKADDAEKFNLVEDAAYDSLKELAKDIVCMGLEALKTSDDGEVSYITKFTIPEFIGEAEILGKNEVVLREELNDGDKAVLKNEVVQFVAELAEKKAGKNTK